MHIVITGSSGFIGSRLINKINSNKKIKKITLIYNRTQPKITKNGVKIDYVKQNLANKLSLKKFKFKANRIIHLGEYSKPSKTKNVYNYNVKIFDNVLKIANLIKCKNIIYLSSTEAIGPNGRKKKLNENSKPRPVTKYGMSKLRNENILRINKTNIKFTILRLTTIYGPGSSEFEKFFLLNRFRIFPLRSNLKCIEYFHVDDLIYIINKFTFLDFENETYNIAPSKLISLNEILNSIAVVTKKNWVNFFLIAYITSKIFKYFFNSSFKRLTDYYWNSSNLKIKKKINFKEISFIKGVKETYECYKKSK